MPKTKRVVPTVLLFAGVVLVFGGISAALGFTASGVVASVAAIATLLYAGAVWFGAAAPPPSAPVEAVLVFDHALCIVCGAERGSSLLAQFPAELHSEIQARCSAALGGESARFTCAAQRGVLAFDAAPVRTAEGAIIYGILISGAAAGAAA